MSKFPPVIILAGGLGTRIASVYPELPKAMIPVKGMPFIGHQLTMLARQSIDEVILCVGHRCQPLVDYVGSGKTFGINVRYSYDEEKLLGTGGAVYKAKSTYSLDKPFAVMYGDSYLDSDFTPIYDSFLRSKKLALLTVFKNKDQWIPSNLACESAMVVRYSKENPTADMQYVDYGLSIFDSQVFNDFVPNEPFDLARPLGVLIRNNQLAAYEVKRRFYEAGSPAGLKDLEAHLAINSRSESNEANEI